MVLTAEELADFSERPEAFDLDYAKFILALRESQKPAPKRPWVDQGSTLVALIASIVAVATAGTTAWTSYREQATKASEQTFNNQVAITKIYFDKFAGAPPNTSCPDLALYVEAALTMASLDDAKAAAAIKANAPPDDNRDGHAGERRLALVLYRDLQHRIDRRFCDSALGLQPATANGVANVEAGGATDAASYGTKPLLPTAATNPQSVSVYFQIPTGSDSAARQAAAFATKLATNRAFHSAGVEPVPSVPNHDQIRIYHAADAGQAGDLKRLLGLTEAQIVNLQSAYPKLPGHVMEVWIARPDAGSGSANTNPS